jgi:two-component system, NtrC family, response regulator GlrR
MRDVLAPRTTVQGTSALVPNVEVSVSPPDGRVVTFKLGIRPLLFGTGQECDGVLADPRVSSRHCTLTLTERGVMMRDLGSKNGSFVEGVRIIESWLHPGKKAIVGDSLLTLRVAGEPARVPISRNTRFGEVVGATLPMRVLFAQLERAAATPEPVLLLGEPGTDRRLLARGIHDASPWNGGPFVALDCGAVAQSLLEAELFGSAKGARAGLFEQANGGTLFIDAIGELPLELQPRVLRVIETRQSRRLGSNKDTRAEARVVAAAHRDLLARVAAGAFRADLYQRLAGFEAVVPPLRERAEDIPLLVERFLAFQIPPRTLDDLPENAIELLQGYRWPGNVVELRAVLARLLLPSAG